MELSKFKEYADDKSTVAEFINLVSESLENIVETGENAGYQHFLLFHNVSKGSCRVRCLETS